MDADMDEGTPRYFCVVTHLELAFPDTTYRANALLFQGSPISQLTTARLFAYATHFDTHPLGLEWVDDQTCVFVFETKHAAREALIRLRKAEEEDIEGLLPAKAIPMTLWPAEVRLSNTLGQGEGLKGSIRMRWATHEDVKKKGAKSESQFYKKHGETAGKELHGERAPAKRRRGEDGSDSSSLAARLDAELDDFRRDDRSASPPSKMRSDYIATDGRSLVERATASHPDGLGARISAAPVRRSRGGRSKNEERGDYARVRPARRPARERSREGRSQARPRKTQEELDAELDAFLNEKADS